MAFQISPGVNVSEIDLTTVVPAVSTTEAGIVGQFNWGPVNQRILVDTEFSLVNTFSTPTDDTAADFFTAASFLAYGNQLWVVRAQPTGGYNANADGDTATLVKNENEYTQQYLESGISAAGYWTAKYPGKLGNSLKVGVCGTANAWQTTLSGNVYAVSGESTIYANRRVEGLAGSGTTGSAVWSLSTSDQDAWGIDDSSVGFVANSLSNGDIITLTAADRGTSVSGQYANWSITTNSTGNTVTALTLADKGSFFTTAPTSPDPTFTFTIGAESYQRTLSANVIVSVSATDSLSVLNPQAEDLIVLNGISYTIASSTSNTIVIEQKYDQDTGVVQNPKRRWEFYDYFDAAPGTSDFADNRGGNSDELHIVVVDEDGDWTGQKNEVLERYSNLSKAKDARTSDGATNFYKTKINNNSKYIWWTKHLEILGANNAAEGSSDFGSNITTYSKISSSLSGGSNGTGATNAAKTAGYDEFKNAEAVDVSIILLGPPSPETENPGLSNSYQVPNYVIQNICETRRDCVACISPPRNAVVDNSSTITSEQEDIIDWRNNVVATSFAVMDSGWKYMYDRYNDTYRWVPLNGDIGGLMVRTDATKDPWFSPAGYNRGTLKNVIKLAYNPDKGQRDQLYKNGINPVTSFPGQGVVLFGDKTLLQKPSAFDRINVRRLFIVLEKAISTAAQYALFEFNDAFTRSQFKNLVEPFLRDVKGRRGIYDFKVVCDETNNTGDIIDNNQFVGDIYIKPARSINFVQLNFVAARTGVEFDEIIGRT